MTWQRFVVGWVVVACIAGPLVWRRFKQGNHRADWAWQQEWDGNDFWDVPDDAAVRAARVDWLNDQGGQR